MVELVITITLIGILALVAIPSFINVGEVNVEAAATKLLSDLTYARQLARNQNGIYGISFDEALETYTVHLYDPATNTQTTVTDPLTRSSMVINFNTLTSLQGVDIQNPTFGGTTVIRFTPKGIPQNGTNNDLTAAGSVTLSHGGRSRTLWVQPRTGELSY